MTEIIARRRNYPNKPKKSAPNLKLTPRRATYVIGLLLIGLGFALGHFFFPKEVVRTAYTEKRVEVPVEVIKYVERISENKPGALATKEKNTFEGANPKGILTRIADDTISTGRTPAQRFTAQKSSVRKGMSKAEVEDTLGAPSEVVEANGDLYWYYSDKERLTGGLIVLRSEGLFSPYKVIEVAW
jgi:hypothetical protein